MNIDTVIKNNVMYVTLVGELDEYSASYVREFLDNAFIIHEFSDVVFDLSALDFMDSTGIGVMLGRYKSLRSKNKKAYIMSPNQTIEKIFRMSGIFEIMPKLS